MVQWVVGDHWLKNATAFLPVDRFQYADFGNLIEDLTVLGQPMQKTDFLSQTLF